MLLGLCFHLPQHWQRKAVAPVPAGPTALSPAQWPGRPSTSLLSGSASAEPLSCCTGQGLGECRPSHAVSNGAVGSTDQTLPDWPCLAEPEAHVEVPQVCAVQVVAQRTASLCPTGTNPHFAKEKSTAPDCWISNFSGITAATETGRNSLLHLQACSLLRLSTVSKARFFHCLWRIFSVIQAKLKFFNNCSSSPHGPSHMSAAHWKGQERICGNFVPLPVWMILFLCQFESWEAEQNGAHPTLRLCE